MTDIDTIIHILITLNINYADYYRPDGRGEVHICNSDFEAVGVIYFDADGNFESCGIAVNCF